MKKLLNLLLLLSCCSGISAQYKVSTGEYLTLILDTPTYHLYQINSVATLVTTLPPIKDCFAGAHHEAAIDTAGNLWLAGDNSYGELCQGNKSALSGWYEVTRDSSGNPVTGVVQAYLGTPTDCDTFGWNTTILTRNGTVLTGGATIGSLRGSGSTYPGGFNNTYLVPVAFPAGTFIVKIIISNIGIALDSAGNVWTWGGNNCSNLNYTALGQGTTTPNYNTPTKISLPSRAKDIAGGETGSWNYALLTNGSLYGWGPFLGALGIGYGNSGSWWENPYGGALSPELLDTALHFPHTITGIYCNSSGSYALLSDSTLWFWGDEANGCGGIGVEINYATYPTPYSWDQSFGELGQRKPIQIAPGFKFAGLFVNNNLCYYAYASDRYGNLYSWGRGKAGCLGNQIIACDNIFGGINATYPNSFDVPWITPINMTALFGTTTYASTCPLCIGSPGGSPCSNCTNPLPATVNPVLTASVINNNTIVLNSSGSSNTKGYYFAYILFTQTSGTAVNMKVQTGATDTLYNVANGTYGFQLKLIDNNWDSASVSSSVTVNYTPPQNYIPGKRGHRKLYVP